MNYRLNDEEIEFEKRHAEYEKEADEPKPSNEICFSRNGAVYCLRNLLYIVRKKFGHFYAINEVENNYENLLHSYENETPINWQERMNKEYYLSVYLKKLILEARNKYVEERQNA